MDVTAVSQEMEQARSTFHQLIRDATAADLRRRSAGTRRTNRQLLFHTVFGHLVVRTLLPLVRASGGSQSPTAGVSPPSCTPCASRTT